MSATSKSCTHSPAECAEQEKAGFRALDCAESQKQDEIVDEEALPTLTSEQEKKLWRKVDRRILPILILMYLSSFMDRSAPLYVFLGFILLMSMTR